MAKRAVFLSWILGAIGLQPAAGYAQSPFEEDGVIPSPSPPEDDATIVKDPFEPGRDDQPAVPAPKLTGGPVARPPVSESGRGFRVLSSSKIAVRLRSPDPGATFSILSGSSTGTSSTFGTTFGSRGHVSFSTSTSTLSSARFDRVCTAPCTVELDAGVQRWLLELPDGRSVATDPMVISTDMTIDARYVSNNGTRVVLALFGSLAVATGTIIAVTSLGKFSSSDSSGSGPGWLAFGLGFDLLGFVLFKGADNVSDSIEVVTTTPRRRPPSRR